MKIKNRLSLLFTALTAAILLIFAALIYVSAATNRETEFYKSLKKEAITKANLFFNAKVDSKTLQTIYLSNREVLNEVETAIYDTSFTLLYHDAISIDAVKESQQMINSIRNKNLIEFYQKDWQVVGLKYTFEGKNYIVIATAFDQYGYSKLKSLGKNSLIMFICAIIFIYALGRFFSKKALTPIVEMNDKAKNISATNLHLRIDSTGKDELAELAKTFNQMLERLEQSFEAQKDFVSNISHELRTPLSTIITELQLAVIRERNLEEYKTVIHNVLVDSQKLAKLSNSLLDFAKASYDPSVITFKEVRLDEILLDAQNQVMNSDKLFTISLAYEGNIDEERFVKGNEYLLKTAFINLMENACKFSIDKHCSITIAIQQDSSILQFKDKGIGISEEDLHKIFTPFYRGKNKVLADGNGIGLPLTKKIVELHHGTISVETGDHSGTTFEVILPNSKD